jgi:uncharacterized phage protein gp47/JayE
MAGSFDTLSLDEQTELQVAAFANQLPDKNIARNSDNWKRQRVTAGATTDLHAHVDASQRDALPDKAGEATINDHGDTVGVTRRGATPASGANAGKVRGTAGSAWTTSNTLVHKSGLRFRPTANGSIPARATEALLGVIAIDTGPRTRLTAGETLNWETSPAGLENEVELVADLSAGGEDVEPIGEYRARILNRIAQPAMGGNANDWKQWILDSNAAIKGAYVYPNRNGLGSMDLAGLKAGTGAARLLDASERLALQDYVNALRPVHCGIPRVLQVLLQTQNVELKIDPELGSEFTPDWDDATTTPVVLSWTAGTRTLLFTAARPASMGVGHRLTVAGTLGLEMKIESLSGTDGVVVEDALGQTPAGAALVYSGGPLVTPARDAIVALFDSLGPRVGTFGYGDWFGSLLVNKVGRAVQALAGVYDHTLVTPVANVEPTAETYPFDAQLYLLTAGNVLARYM